MENFCRWREKVFLTVLFVNREFFVLEFRPESLLLSAKIAFLHYFSLQPILQDTLGADFLNHNE